MKYTCNIIISYSIGLHTIYCSTDSGGMSRFLSFLNMCFLVDVNECEVYKTEGATRLCVHACINTPGSYRCACPAGYKLLNDGKNCEGKSSVNYLC